MTTGPTKYAAPAAACASDVLVELGRSDAALPLAELARRLSHTKSLIYRTLKELERADFVTRDANTNYRLGLRAFEVGVSYVASNPINSSVRQVLQQLADASGVATNLGVLRDDEVLYLMKFDGSSSYVTISRVGGRVPATCVANGKALLAAMLPADVRKIISEPLATMTPQSHRTLASFEQDLGVIRERGYARDDSEAVMGRCGLAFTIPYPLAPTGLAAISLSTDAEDIGGDEGERLLGLLRSARDRIRREVGAREGLPREQETGATHATHVADSMAAMF